MGGHGTATGSDIAPATEPRLATGGLAVGTPPLGGVRRSFLSHRTVCHPPTIPWDGYAPNTIEELEQLGF